MEELYNVPAKYNDTLWYNSICTICSSKALPVQGFDVVVVESAGSLAAAIDQQVDHSAFALAQRLENYMHVRHALRKTLGNIDGFQEQWRIPKT